MLYIITYNLLLIEVVDVIPVLTVVLLAITVDELETLPVILSVNITADNNRLHMLYIITYNLLLIEVVDVILVLTEVLLATTVATVDELETLPVILISVNITADNNRLHMLYIITYNLLLIEVKNIISVLTEVLLATIVDELETLPMILILINITAGLEHVLLP